MGSGVGSRSGTGTSLVAGCESKSSTVVGGEGLETIVGAASTAATSTIGAATGVGARAGVGTGTGNSSAAGIGNGAIFGSGLTATETIIGVGGGVGS